jgi:tetratricopeptide (TPR) repeat protein
MVMSYIRNGICILPVVLLTACAAALVPVTNDPMEKLAWAEELYDKQQRPLPAEKLINEAIAICSKENDLNCLGKANLNYGFFFRSPSIRKWEKIYKEHGFIDEDATYENRLVKSKEYFESAISYYTQENNFGALTNAYLNLGFAYYFLKEHEKECAPYKQSLEYNLKAIEKNPELPTALPQGFSSFKEYIEVQEKRAGCK